MNPTRLLAGALAALALSACATAPGPVEVTRFVAPSAAAMLGQGTVFVEAAPGMEGDSLALAPYKAAVAGELKRLGYGETARSGAGQVAQVSLERYAVDPAGRRGPVSVGVGGATGSYGSSVGLGVGINLGGDGRREGTLLKVVLRDAATQKVLWEGRADFQVSPKSPLASNPANAQTVAEALFREFPGNSGETIRVKAGQ